LGRHDEAIAAYKQSVQLDPYNVGAYQALGTILTEQGKAEEAIAIYQQAIRLNPDRACALYGRLGTILRARGKSAQAEAAYRKAFAFTPRNAPEHNDLAWGLANCPDANLCDPPRAVELAKIAVAKNPAHYGYLNTLVVALYRAGEWEAAITTFEKKIVPYWSGTSFDFFFLAMAHWHVGNKEQARKWYDRGVQWMESWGLHNEELRRIRVETEALLGIKNSEKPAKH